MNQSRNFNGANQKIFPVKTFSSIFSVLIAGHRMQLIKFIIILVIVNYYISFMSAVMHFRTMPVHET